MGRERGQVAQSESAIIDREGFATLVQELAAVFASTRAARRGPSGGLRELARISGLRLATVSEWARGRRVGLSRPAFARLELGILLAAEGDGDRFAVWFDRLARVLDWPDDGRGPWPAPPDVRAEQRRRWERRSGPPALLESLLPAYALEQLRRGRFSPQLATNWPADRRALATPRDAAALQRHLPLLVGLEAGVVDHPDGPRVVVHLLDPESL